MLLVPENPNDGCDRLFMQFNLVHSKHFTSGHFEKSTAKRTFLLSLDTPTRLHAMLLGMPAQPCFLVEGIWPSREIHLIAGPSGAGKTKWLLETLVGWSRSEEHTSELQSPTNLVC